MEQGTVCISIQEYERLKLVDERKDEPKAHTICISYGGFGSSIIHTDKKAVFDICRRFKDLREYNRGLAYSLKGYDYPCDALRECLLSMSVFQFIKWKKANR